MIEDRRLAAAAVAGLIWLALFSLLYTFGEEIGAWPTLPPGGFQSVDLVTGFAGAVALLAALALPSPHVRRFG
ncbi:MAG TPA: hypothetical protein VGK86_12760 [Thermoanaerobaculia bacterium]